MGGLFIETPKPTGAVTKLSFLVQEGQIRAEALVWHAKPNSGLGLKFIAVTEDDRPKLAALVIPIARSKLLSGSLVSDQFLICRAGAMWPSISGSCLSPRGAVAGDVPTAQMAAPSDQMRFAGTQFESTVRVGHETSFLDIS